MKNAELHFVLSIYILSEKSINLEAFDPLPSYCAVGLTDPISLRLFLSELRGSIVQAQFIIPTTSCQLPRLLTIMDALRNTVQPLTHSFPAPIRDFGISLIGPECYKNLILDIDLTSTQCLKLAISKALGIATVAGSSVVKVPQIIKLLSSQSGAGISFLSYALETSAMMTTLAYSARNGFPFNTYGETAMIAAQNVVISLLVLRYTGRTVLAAVFVAALASAGYSLFNEGVIDMQTLTYAQMGAGLLGVVSKLPQVWTIYSEGGTGQLSAFMVSWDGGAGAYGLNKDVS